MVIKRPQIQIEVINFKAKTGSVDPGKILLQIRSVATTV